MVGLESNVRKTPGIRVPPVLFGSLTRAILLAVLFVAAFAIRVHNIQQFPLEFHPIRQYRSAFIARYFYYQHTKSIPAWKKQLAFLLRQREGTLEPPILECLASVTYRLTGGERVWIPRLCSSIFWLIGGAFLYLLSKKIVSADAAVFSVAFYLFMSFGVIASRSFQPDPLMVMMFVISIYAILLYYDQPILRRFVIAVTVSALAILIKPVCLFAILAAFISVAVSERGLRRVMKDPKTWTFGIAALLPSLIFYSYGFLTGGYIRFQAESSFHPSLYFQSFYWLGWLHMINMVVGILAFCVALLSVPLFRKGLPRSTICGLWAGYFLFGLVFNHHISTHSYYQLQLIPIVALGLGSVVASAFSSLVDCVRPDGRYQIALACALIFTGAVAIAFYVRANWESIYYVDRDQVTIAQKIGERVEHSSKVLFLSSANGEILEYHGELVGIPWPLRSDMYAGTGWAQPNLTAEERFKKIARQFPSDFFVVTEMDEYRAQPELAEFLNRNFSLLVRDRRYLIFGRKH